MEIKECLRTRRSVRSYTDQEISEETINELLELGVTAPSGSFLQPWGFVVIRDKAELDEWAVKITNFLRENLEKTPHLLRYKDFIQRDDFHVFNHAPYMIAIYGDKNSKFYICDCSMVAQNIMLAAHSMGIGTCWIGFAEPIMNSPEFKERYNVPDNFEIVAPIALGYKKGNLQPLPRKSPIIFNR